MRAKNNKNNREEGRDQGRPPSPWFARSSGPQAAPRAPSLFSAPPMTEQCQFNVHKHGAERASNILYFLQGHQTFIQPSLQHGDLLIAGL